MNIILKNHLFQSLLMLALVLPISGTAQNRELESTYTKGLVTDTTYEVLVQNFFNDFGKTQIKPAIENLFSTNKWLNNPEKTNLMSSNLITLTKQLGNYQNSLLITKKSVGPMVLCSYMVIYDRQPIRFTFIFYRPKDQWMLYNFEYDDKLDDELKEAAGVHRLYENMPFKK